MSGFKNKHMSMDAKYCQVKEMTDDEMFDMYNKCEKDTLIKMLIECNKVLNKLSPKIYPA